MAHKFDPDKSYKLHSEKRRKLLPPEKTLKQCGLQKGDVAADIGCGTGYFTLPAARIVGEGGTVYAVDTSRRMLEGLKSRIKEEELSNIEIIHSGEYRIPVEKKSCSFVLLSAVLHEVEDKRKFLSEVKELLHPEGTLAVLEWNTLQPEEGPPLQERIAVAELSQMLMDTGFWIRSRQMLGSPVYAVSARLN
ncbi:MAG: class I SAM-dependent methyltransferase [Spirochaetia bacterium]